MPSRTAADRLVDVLRAWNVDTIFAADTPGFEILCRALEGRGGTRIVRAPLEETAGFLACGYARLTGRLGVCLAPGGLRGLPLLEPLARAAADRVPVLVIAAADDGADESIDRPQVETERFAVELTVRHGRITDPSRVEALAALACRSALARRGAAWLTFPSAIQGRHAAEPGVRTADREPAAAPARIAPLADGVQHAAALLNSGRRIAILAGAGSLGATDELEVVAETLGAVIVKTIGGKASAPDDSPYVAAEAGLVGTSAAREALDGCDTLLVLGASTPVVPGHGRTVQVDRDPIEFGVGHPVHAGILGDVRETLTALIPLLRRNPNRRFLEHAQHRARAWWDEMEAGASGGSEPLTIRSLAAELGARIGSHAVVASDAGTLADACARLVPVRRGQTFLLSASPTTWNGIAYAMASGLVDSHRQAIAIVDGRRPCLMHELASAARSRLAVKVVLLRTAGRADPPIDFAAAAAACGAGGHHLEHRDQSGAAIARALAAPGPALMDAVVQPAPDAGVSARIEPVLKEST